MKCACLGKPWRTFHDTRSADVRIQHYIATVGLLRRLARWYDAMYGGQAPRGVYHAPVTERARYLSRLRLLGNTHAGGKAVADPETAWQQSTAMADRGDGARPVQYRGPGS